MFSSRAIRFTRGSDWNFRKIHQLLSPPVVVQFEIHRHGAMRQFVASCGHGEEERAKAQKKKPKKNKAEREDFSQAAVRTLREATHQDSSGDKNP